MEAVYGWVKNIIYYMIFLSVVNNLLADSKYGKYIRFFSGMVLILLVVSPFTGGLHLDEQISSMFKSISFQNDTDDLKQDLWGSWYSSRRRWTPWPIRPFSGTSAHVACGP